MIRQCNAVVIIADISNCAEETILSVMTILVLVRIRQQENFGINPVHRIIFTNMFEVLDSGCGSVGRDTRGSAVRNQPYSNFNIEHLCPVNYIEKTEI